MTLSAVLIVVLVLLLLGVLPIYPHSQSWGPYPAGGIGTLLVVLLLLYVFGVLR